MSTKAQSVLEAFEELPPGEQREVCEQMMRRLAQPAKSAPGNDPIRSARGMFASGGLTEALLASRAEERRRG
jgi:hypothetical protein